MRQFNFIVIAFVCMFGLFGCFIANEEPASTPSTGEAGPSGDAGVTEGAGGAAGSDSGPADGGAGQEASTADSATDGQICKPKSEQECVPKAPANCSVGYQVCGSAGTFWGSCVCSQDSGSGGAGGSSGSDSGGGGSGGAGGGGSVTCKGHCGSSQSVSGSNPPCYCDNACQSYQDCCADYATFCGSGGSGGSSGSGGAGGSGGSPGTLKVRNFKFTHPADGNAPLSVTVSGLFWGFKDNVWFNLCSTLPGGGLVKNGNVYTCQYALPASGKFAVNVKLEYGEGSKLPSNLAVQYACYGVGVNCQDKSCFKDYGTFELDGVTLSATGGFAETNQSGGCNYVVTLL